MFTQYEETYTSRMPHHGEALSSDRHCIYVNVTSCSEAASPRLQYLMSRGAVVALRVYPLIISSPEHFDDTLQPFKRYKKSAREADRFQNLLGI